MGGPGFSPEGQAPGGPGFSPEGQNPPIAGVPVEPRPARYTGLVKTFDDVKGWGHIECEASRQVYGKDIFLLRSACNGLPVTANNQLEFAVIMSPKGPQARDVCLVDYGPAEFQAIQRETRPSPY